MVHTWHEETIINSCSTYSEAECSDKNRPMYTHTHTHTHNTRWTLNILIILVDCWYTHPHLSDFSSSHYLFVCRVIGNGAVDIICQNSWSPLCNPQLASAITDKWLTSRLQDEDGCHDWNNSCCWVCSAASCEELGKRQTTPIVATWYCTSAQHEENQQWWSASILHVPGEWPPH